MLVIKLIKYNNMKNKKDYFLNNIRKGERYNILAILTWKRKDAIKVFFNRNKIDVSDEKDFLEYLKKNYIFNR